MVRFWIVRSWGTVKTNAVLLLVRIGEEYEWDEVEDGNGVDVGVGGCLLSPDTFLMKICIVSMDSGEADREIGLEGRILSGFY